MLSLLFANNEIASTMFSPLVNGEIDILFSGLPLPAGSYYLTMTGASTNNQAWNGVDSGPDPIMQAPSVSATFWGLVDTNFGRPAAYAPASSFLDPSSDVPTKGLSLDVESTAAPEPSTFALVGAGFLLAGRLRRRAQ